MIRSLGGADLCKIIGGTQGQRVYDQNKENLAELLNGAGRFVLSVDKNPSSSLIPAPVR